MQIRFLAQPAMSWEFRWKVPFLFASQPLLAVLAFACSNRDTAWYSPAFSPAIGYVAAAMATLGMLWRLQSTTTLQAHVMASRNPDASRFVTDGFYGAVRNPLYVASLLLFGGYALFFGWPWALGFVLLHWLRYDRIVRLEESHLRSHWNMDFQNYCNQVPRWLPRPTRLLTALTSPISLEGVLSNLVFVAMWAGLVMSVIRNDLVWVIPFEVAGGVLMLGHRVMSAVRQWLRERHKQVGISTCNMTSTVSGDPIVVGSSLVSQSR